DLTGQPREPVETVGLLSRAAAAGPDVAHSVHARLVDAGVLVVRVDPLRVLRRQDVRLDPERRELLGKLEPALHASAARGRKIESAEQDLAHLADACPALGVTRAAAIIDGPRPRDRQNRR